MLIAISQRNDKNKYCDSVDNLENNYVKYLEEFRVRLVVIPNSTKDVSAYFEKIAISGIVLSGGNDINPRLYDGLMQEGLNISIERDEIEKKLLDVAINRKLPVLGICRGMQFINVFFKGKLINIKRDVGDKIKHVNANHTIKVMNEEVISLVGNTLEVNSYHNQGVNLKTLSADLKPFAQADDGVIEGIYHPLLPIAGIQWHPERKSPDEEVNRRIVNAFLNKELFWK